VDSLTGLGGARRCGALFFLLGGTPVTPQMRPAKNPNRLNAVGNAIRVGRGAVRRFSVSVGRTPLLLAFVARGGSDLPQEVALARTSGSFFRDRAFPTSG